jgi:hypothetical protein
MTERLFLGLLTPSEILAILTAVLVGVTLYYAIQTKALVDESQRARATAILPRLVLDIRTVAAGVGFVRVRNVGPGPAFDVEARITLMPDGFTIPWGPHIFVPGQAQEFHVTPPDEPNAQLGYINRLVERYSHIRLEASYKNALGTTLAIDETIEIREWWKHQVDAHTLVVKDWSEEQAKELDKMTKAIADIGRSAKRFLDLAEPGEWTWKARVQQLPEEDQAAARRVLGQLGLVESQDEERADS